MKTQCKKCEADISQSKIDMNQGMCGPCCKGTKYCNICGIQVWRANESDEYICTDCESNRESSNKRDKLWLNKFSIGSLEKLLSKEPDYYLDSLLLCLEERLERKKEFTNEESLVLSLVGFERELNHGGFDTYLTNSSGAYADRVASDLKSIGLNELATIVSTTYLKMGLSKSPALTEIEELTDSDEYFDDCRYSDAAGDVDEYFYTQVETLAPQLFEWLKKNRAQVSI